MAVKPVTVPQWASDLTNNTEPSLVQKQTGWTPNQDGISDYDNWWKELVYRWIQYVNDGVLTGITIDNLLVTGNAQINGTLTTNGAATFASNVTVTGEVLRPERSKAYSPKMDGHVGAGTTGYNLSTEFLESSLVSDGGSSQLKNLDLVPGDRIKKVRLTFTTLAGSPDVRILLSRPNGYSMYAPINPTSVVDLGGTVTKAEYIVPDGGVTLGLCTSSGALSPGLAQRAGLRIDTSTNNTSYREIEVIYDHVAIPTVA